LIFDEILKFFCGFWISISDSLPLGTRA